MFVTYTNTANPHVTIHREGCSQIAKRGGEHKYGQGEYRNHATLEEAETYGRSTRLEVKNCSYCKPGSPDK